eukprot:CAMPEP_0196773814 /NCGR_PEP_ID=MMETSP1104-20130614/2998_1 /TAXON_ID=33652 /ORGANISM="Cafeteria sp., Strain Caron Lab Isolate" /LENGTH=123 /DNA_ID=CAMNT_0042143963 /DNA_START=388 /DNA_END=760 /DNA_ORIENTATION=+
MLKVALVDSNCQHHAVLRVRANVSPPLQQVLQTLRRGQIRHQHRGLGATVVQRAQTSYCSSPAVSQIINSVRVSVSRFMTKLAPMVAEVSGWKDPDTSLDESDVFPTPVVPTTTTFTSASSID